MIAFFVFGGLLGLFFGLIGLAIVVLLFVFWIMMLIHAITNKGLSDVEKIMWVLIVVFLHALGALLYFFLGRPKAPGATGLV
ncbi:conserved exported hypothetical protein [Verrucomicrobia bacterium]|nr:conserved exported hypothetical protein [Verrucomicrobiota bacterium]